jgi:aspartate carbamoyltransferase catalytic subunit
LKHLITVSDLSIEDIEKIFSLTDSFFEQIEGRKIKKVPLLTGSTVVLLFSEPSTRTRVSFELAAKRLSSDVITITSTASSLKKGESLEDTAMTLYQYGVDALIIRHSSEGAPDKIAGLNLFPVINAGDGKRAHPTQALLDAYTVYRELGKIKGLKIAFIGDIVHSRVARSGMELFSMLGAEVFAVAPVQLLPTYLPEWITVLESVDEAMQICDVLYFLRIQFERLSERESLDIETYREKYALSRRKISKISEGIRIMHPGPVNRGIEMDSEAVVHPQSLILKQVKYGLYVRMAVLSSYIQKAGENLEGID